MGLGRERWGAGPGASFAGMALAIRFLEPARVVGELGGGFERPLDEGALALVPYRVVGERCGGLCEFDEADAAWQLFGEGRVDQRHPAAPRQVAPDGVAGGLFVELG